MHDILHYMSKCILQCHPITTSGYLPPLLLRCNPLETIFFFFFFQCTNFSCNLKGSLSLFFGHSERIIRSVFRIFEKSILVSVLRIFGPRRRSAHASKMEVAFTFSFGFSLYFGKLATFNSKIRV